MRLLTRIGLTLGGALAVAGAAAGYVVWRAQQSPANAPDRLRRDPARPLVVCAGASVTQGRMSAPYVDLLEARLGGRFQFANAGRNGDLAYNLRQRLDPVVALRPSVVVLQIGTNDVNASLDPRVARRYQSAKGLPVLPDRAFYRENLLGIVQRLRRDTTARIAVLSLPLLGEDLDSHFNERVRSYDVVVREVAASEAVTYLPLHETMEAALRALPPARSRTPANRMVGYAQAQHFLLGRSFDQIGERYGYRLLSDGIHLNSRGAAVVADVVESYLHGQADLPPPEKGDSR